jgi:DUF1680 family protein
MIFSKYLPVLALTSLLALFACQNSPSKPYSGPVEAFPLDQIELLDGPFKHATELNIQSLLQYEPDRLLARFRQEAGLETKAEPYGGWEGQSLAGHSLGHHLSACALMFQTTGQDTFKSRAQYIVEELTEVQIANGGGYIGAFPDGKKVFEEEIKAGNIRSQGFDLNGIWAPFYTHHKVMAGLRDAYRLLGIEPALEIEKNFADWIGSIVLDLDNESVQKMLHCEFGGVQETLADLYLDTQDEKYLKIARIFHHEAIIDSLALGKDILPNKHGNTQIPKLIASTRLFNISGENQDLKPATFFWERVVNHHSYVTGGHGNHEYFGQPDQLNFRLSDATTETCNVYNMLKLSRELFLLEPSARIADYYERALFNHILSTQHPETGRVIYNLSLEMGGHKTYQNPYWFTCCVGSGMETHSKYGANIYYKGENALFVNQFIASTLEWEEKDLQLTQETNYPEEQQTRFRLTLQQPQKLTIYLRYPAWAEQGLVLKINGKSVDFDAQPGSYIPLKRTWNDGDEISLELPFHLRLESMPDNSNRIAVMYGPLVLAGELGPVDDPQAYEFDYVPVLMSEERNPEQWLESVENQVNTFQTKGVGKPRDVVFKPFYQVHDRRYSVYFDLFNEESWAAHQADYHAELERKKALEAKTYDGFQPGEMQPERNHHFQGDKLNIREDFKGRKARGAERGGWLSFEMEVDPENPMSLVIEYWGGFTGSKTFDILIDGKKIATENISGKKDGQFIDVYYPIPPELSKGKEKITVKFAPHTGHRAGPFFYARTVSEE